MKRFKVKKGKGELNSTGGNYLCGLLLERHAKRSLPKNFQPRRSDAISDQSVLLTMIGLLILGMLGNLLNMLGVVFYVQQVVQGLIVVAAVVVSTRVE